MNTKEKIAGIISRKVTLSHQKVFLFGSRANGKADARSDIDIGIEASKQIPLNIMAELKAELDDLPVLQKIDLVDFNIVNDDFKEIASQDMEVIYEK